MWLCSVQCCVLSFSNKTPNAVIIFCTLQNTLLFNILTFFAISFLQFAMSISELNCKAACVAWVLRCNRYHVSWFKVNISLVTKTDYFSFNFRKLLPNHTVSLHNRQSFSHYSSARHNKFLIMKNSNISQRRIFQIPNLKFETSCRQRQLSACTEQGTWRWRQHFPLNIISRL